MLLHRSFLFFGLSSDTIKNLVPILQGQCFRSLKLLVVSLFYKKQCYFAIHIFQLCMKNYIDVCRSLEVKTTSSNIFGIIGTYRFFIKKPYIYHYICERVLVSRILPNSKRLNPPRRLHNSPINIFSAGHGGCFFVWK